MGRKRPPKPAKKATDSEKTVSVEQITEEAREMKVTDEELQTELEDVVQPEIVEEERKEGASMEVEEKSAVLEEPRETG